MRPPPLLLFRNRLREIEPQMRHAPKRVVVFIGGARKAFPYAAVDATEDERTAAVRSG